MVVNMERVNSFKQELNILGYALMSMGANNNGLHQEQIDKASKYKRAAMIHVNELKSNYDNMTHADVQRKLDQIVNYIDTVKNAVDSLINKGIRYERI